MAHFIAVQAWRSGVWKLIYLNMDKCFLIEKYDGKHPSGENYVCTFWFPEGMGNEEVQGDVASIPYFPLRGTI